MDQLVGFGNAVWVAQSGPERSRRYRAACVLDAEQGCLTMRGPKRREARTVTRAFAGSLAKDKKAQASFLALIGKAKKSG